MTTICTMRRNLLEFCRRLGTTAPFVSSHRFPAWVSSSPVRLAARSTLKRLFSCNRAARLTIRRQRGRTDLSQNSIPNSSEDSSTSMDGPSVRSLLLKGKLFDPSGRLLIPATELRNACKCEMCVNPSDRQRNYHWADIPSNIRLESYEIDGVGTCHVRWKNDVPGFQDHISSYTTQAISTAPSMKTWHGHTVFNRPTYLWGTDDYNMEACTVPYEDFIGTSESLASALGRLHSTGLVFITDVPEDELSVGKIAQRIGPLRNSFYGSTWDVKSVPNARNVAYTSRNLGVPHGSSSTCRSHLGCSCCTAWRTPAKVASRNLLTPSKLSMSCSLNTDLKYSIICHIRLSLTSIPTMGSTIMTESRLSPCLATRTNADTFRSRNTILYYPVYKEYTGAHLSLRHT